MNTLRARVALVMIAVVAVSVGLTAWLAGEATKNAVSANARQSLENDAAIYRALIDFGIEQRGWDEAQPLVEVLARRFDRRIALTTDSGGLLADSELGTPGDPGPLPPDSARLDPVSPFLRGKAPLYLARPTDPGIVSRAVTCLDEAGAQYDLVEVDGGQMIPQPPRSAGSVPGQDFQDCTRGLFYNRGSILDDVIQRSVLRECLESKGRTLVSGTGLLFVREPGSEARADFWSCYNEAARESTAPPVRLLLGSATSLSAFDGLPLWQAAVIVAAILALAIAASWWLSRRLTAPFRRLASAASQWAAGDFGHRVEPQATVEVRTMADAFNSMAESLESSQGHRRQMVRDIAHELGNPLVTMNGTLEAIEDGVYDASPAAIASLAEEARQLSALVRDIQDLAEADSGALGIDSAPCDLTALAASVVEANRSGAEAAGVTLEVGGQGSARVMVDARRIRQVLTNLVSNAIRHTPAAGSVTVEVEGLGFAVIDTGEGISAADRQHIFERFWRADRSRARSTGGGGLGLAIADELVRAHGGRITVSETPGGGSTFRVTGLTPA